MIFSKLDRGWGIGFFLWHHCHKKSTIFGFLFMPVFLWQCEKSKKFYDTFFYDTFEFSKIVLWQFLWQFFLWQYEKIYMTLFFMSPRLISITFIIAPFFMTFLYDTFLWHFILWHYWHQYILFQNLAIWYHMVFITYYGYISYRFEKY